MKIWMISQFLPYLPPSLIMIIGSLFIALTRRYLRLAVVVVLPALTLWQVWNISFLKFEEELQFQLGQFVLLPLYVHPYTLIFATVFCIAAFAAGLFAVMQARCSELVAGFICAGSAIGVCYAGDFITLFLYWEIMAIAAIGVIFSSENPFAGKAGGRYAIMHFLGSILLLAGIVGQISLSGSSHIVEFNADMEILFPLYALDMNGIITWLILLGLLIAAAAPPFSAWLPDSYSKASPTGSVFLASFVTKTAIFLLLTMFAGTKLLVSLGLFMVFYGIVYAIIENNMVRMLSYSFISQLGLMMVGIGIGSVQALNGVAVVVVCSIIYSGLLLMSAGSVFYMTGKGSLSDVGGLYNSMKITTVCCIIGSFSILALPFTAGFVSKDIIISSAVSEELYGVWFLLLGASAVTCLHAGMKFPWLVFFGSDSKIRTQDPPFNMLLAMIFMAALCIVPALPNLTQPMLYRMLPTPVSYVAYNLEHLLTNMQLILFSTLAFFIILPILKPRASITLDFDWLYRGFLRYIIIAGFMILQVPLQFVRILLKKLLRLVQYRLYKTNGPESTMARGWAIGITATWIISLLGIYMVIYMFVPLYHK